MQSSYLVAAAGGIGAALGASLAQFVQWWREHVRVELEERRRREDNEEATARETRAALAQQAAETRSFRRDLAVRMIGIIREVERAALELDRDMQTEQGAEAWRRFVSISTPKLDELVILGSSHGGEGFDELVSIWTFLRTFFTQADLEAGYTRDRGTRFLRVSNGGLWFTKHPRAFPPSVTIRLFYNALFVIYGVLEYSVELSRHSLGATDRKPRLQLGAEVTPPRRQVSIYTAHLPVDDDGEDAEARDQERWEELNSLPEDKLWNASHR